MSRVGFVGRCFAAILLALSGHEAMAQGLLAMEPQPFDDMMSPSPLGPPQRFGDLLTGSEATFSGLQPAPAARPRHARAAQNGRFQAQRRRNLMSEPRQTAFRSPARQHEWLRGVAGSGSALSLAPRTQERRPFSQFCFPSSTIHLQQNERDDCDAGAPASKGRFEELLGR
jgi:hypothetical protein